MLETDLQKYVIDVVRARGGAAYKLSHRFAIGVSDLLVKLPNIGTSVSSPDETDKPHGKCRACGARLNQHLVGIGKGFVRELPALLLEVKQHEGVNTSPYAFKLDVTRPQQQFLRDFQFAGMRVGVLSFLQHNGKLNLAAAVFELDSLITAGLTVHPNQHVSLGRRPESRDEMLYGILEGYTRG